MSTLKTRLQQIIYNIFDPLVGVVRKIGLTPNNITSIGFIINIAASAYLVYPMISGSIPEPSRLIGFGMIILFSGLMDMLDGRMARIYNLNSIYGAFYDSVMDRYSELVMFLGLMAYFIAHDNWLHIFIAFWAMCGSLMVSYSRARAEGLGVDCSVGLLQRPERIILIVATSIMAGLISETYYNIIINIGIGIVALLANFTAFQRMNHVKKQTHNGSIKT